MFTYKVGSSSNYSWGTETIIYIEEDGKLVRSINVMQWPFKDEKLQAERGAKLIQNYLDDLEEAQKPSVTLERFVVEKLLIDKGLLKEGESVEQIKSLTELKAVDNA